MKLKSMVVVIFLLVLSFGGYAFADETAVFAWTPPTHRIVGIDCDQQGSVITPEEITRLEYVFSYRIAGTTVWTNLDTNVPGVSVVLTGYGVSYEASVGARFPGGVILCATIPPLVYTTGLDNSPAGPCSGLTGTPQP